MGQFRKSEDPNQGFLFPPSPSDWLPEGHLVWFIMETIEGLDIDRLLDKYRVSGKGELAYPPRVMLSLLVYGYCTGTFASRKIAVQMENVAFRVIARGHQPTFRTICRFREENHEEFQQLFVQVVQLAQEAGLVKMGTIAIDGSKVKANASKHKAMSYDRMLMEEKRLRSEIAKLTRAAKNQDEVDDKAFGPDFRGDELPEELRTRKSRLATIEAAKKRLEARKAAEAEAKREAEKKDDDSDNKPGAGSTEPTLPKPRDQENFTDPDSRIMPTSGKSFEQGYNAQVAVDANKQIVVAASVTQSTNDHNQLLPVLNASFENTGKAPHRVLADAGYKNESDFAELDAMKINAFVAVGREGKQSQQPKKEQPLTAAMRAKLKTRRGRAQYRRRKGIVEPVFGWVKRVLGFRAFSMRGLRKVAGEWSLVCLALNLRRMATMGMKL
jgi:transposase